MINYRLTNTPTSIFCLFSSKTKEKLIQKPNSLSQESRLHLAYATSALNPLVPPSGRMRSREGSQKIYPQNLEKGKKSGKGERENKENKIDIQTKSKYVLKGKNCTHFNQPNHHNNPTISLYTRFTCRLISLLY